MSYVHRYLEVNLSKGVDMEEIIFMVEESPEGRYVAKGLGVSIYTQADTIPALKEAVVDAVSCHFDDEKRRIIRLHIVREEVIAA